MGKLKFFGLVGVIFVALVFIGFNFPQAKGKPPREEVNWGVKIPVDLKNMLYGTIPNEDYLPHTYINNDNDIKVSVKRLGYTSKGAGKGIYYQFNFVLYNADIPVGFQDVYFDPSSWEYPDPDLSRCVFPVPCNHFDPLYPLSCMECFLNSKHPTSPYRDIYFAFTFFDVDIELMEPEQTIDSSREMDIIGISVYYPYCLPDDPNKEFYHNISSWYRQAEGISSITRIDANTWRITVQGERRVRESYCEEISIDRGKGKSKETRREIYAPLAGNAYFKFHMDWIKNPVQ
ncbi:MAG: hypothetical protein ACETWM_03640 [Candidatus Lokiarchaeia archaeon]